MTRRNVRERGKQVEKCDRSWRLEVTYNPYFTYPQDENRPPLPFPSLPWPWPFERGSGVSGEGCIQLKSSHQCQNGQEQGSVAGGCRLAGVRCVALQLIWRRWPVSTSLYER